MAALSAISPVNAGVASTGAAVAASDTVAQSILGPRGAYIEFINAGAGTDTITISDSGLTPAGNALNLSPGGVISTTLANAGACKVFFLRNEQVNPTTSLITITHSQATGVTYKLYPVGAN